MWRSTDAAAVGSAYRDVMTEAFGVQRIDVGIDGGREAAAALSTAVGLARSLGARLRLVAVAELRFDLAGDPRPSDPAELDRLDRHLAHAVAGLSGLVVETELREGLPDQIIQGLARESDLLILGSRAAYGEAGRTSLGSTSTKVMRGASCPVIVAPAP
jgi:nucleotide-binding universal stress UspA family protein